MAAALTLMCGALMVRRMCEFHFITTMAWLPAILLLVKICIDRPGLRAKLFCTLGAGALLGLSILGGFLQIVNLMGVAIGAYGVLYMILRPQPAEAARGIRAHLPNLCCIAAIVVLGSLIAAPTLLPARELSAFTARQQGAATPLFNDLRPWTLTKFLQSLILFPGPKYESETIRLAGVISIVLAVAGMMHRRRRDVALFGLLCLVFCEMSFGPPLPLSSLITIVTPFSQSSYTRAWDFLMLPFALLVGLGVDAVITHVRHDGWRLVRSGVLLYAGLICLVPMAVWLRTESYLPVQPDVMLIPAATVAAIVFLSTRRLGREARVLAACALAGMLFLETYAWNSQYVPDLSKRKFKELAPLRADAREIPLANTRDADPLANRFLYSMRFAMNGVDPLHFAGVRDTLSGPPREKGAYRLVNNWETTRENHRGNLLFKRSFWLARQYCEGPLPGKEELYPAATTVFLDEGAEVSIPKVARESLPPRGISENAIATPVSVPERLYQSVTNREEVIRDLRIELPRTALGSPAGTAGALHSAFLMYYRSGGAGTLNFWIEDETGDRSTHGKRLKFEPTGDTEKMLELPLPDYPVQLIDVTIERSGGGAAFQIVRAEVASDLNDEDGKIQVTRRGANYVDLRVGPLDGPRVLTFLDADYPGWEARVDGAPAAIVRTNGYFKGVSLGAGEHEVRFEFRPRTTYAAILVSLITAGATLVTAFVILAVKPRRRGAPVAVSRIGSIEQGREDATS
jgi:hypothetical protein